jgi:hypothetical protein
MVCVGVMSALVVQRRLEAATPEQVESAIKRGAGYLQNARNAQGNWEVVAQKEAVEGTADVKKDQWGGLSAIATYALLAAGESPQDARMAKSIEFLKKADITGAYALGLRCQVWPLISHTPDVKAVVYRDAMLLQQSLKRKDEANGFYNYYPSGPGGRYDHSVSQYGVLGMWGCAQTNLEISDDYWKLIDERWRAHQSADGSWAYDFSREDPRPGTITMTAAGVATLFITQDYLYRNAGINCTGNIVNPNIEAGLKWVSEHIADVYKSDRRFYGLYGIERIGVASGYKYFGNVDWYAEGAEFLVENQGGDGSWGGNIPDTAFGLLFLVRGRAPVLMNKLDYTIDTRGDKPKPATWNQRPRDVANLAHWVSKQSERFLNWQIVNLSVPASELHDAPILFISGSGALGFTPAEQAKLKQFIEEGGIILGHADCANAAFTASFRRLGQAMFPYEFRKLPTSHVIFANQQFKLKNPNAVPLLGLSNGAREMMLLLSNGDPGRFWQTQTVGGKEELHQIAANIFLYAVDKQNLRNKGDTYLVHEDSRVQVKRSLNVARLMYAGNWDPEPGGWRRFATVMHNDYATDLKTQTIKLGTGALNQTFPVAHITGTTAFRFDAASRTELQKYIEGGGTLVLDAAGGANEFSISATAELTKMFPGTRLALIKLDNPLYAAAGAKLTDVAYRPYAIKTFGRLKLPRLQGLEINGRLAVILSSEDLSVGLVGMPIDGIVGYEPKSAAKIMACAILSAANKPSK